MYLELKQAAIYLAVIGATRLLAHLNQDQYLQICNRWNGHWMLLVTFLLSSLLQLSIWTLSSSAETSRLHSDWSLYSLVGTAFLLHVVLEVDIQLARCRTRRQIGPALTGGDAGNTEVSFSVGSVSMLVLSLDICIVSLIFYHHSIPITSVSAALVQLLNMTLLAFYWSLAQPSLAQHCSNTLNTILENLRNYFQDLFRSF